MVMDALRGYVQLANGLTEVTKQRAQQAAKALIHQTGADSVTTNLTTRVSDLADEIVATSKSNRQLLQAIVANEVEGAVAKLGFVRVEEVAALARRVAALEAELAAASVAAPAAPAPVKKAPAKKAAAKKAAAKKTAPLRPAPLKQSPAKKAVKKSAAKKA